MHGSYDTGLVLVSALVAVLASFTALDLTGRVSAAQGRARLLWLLSGALAMGTGIWGMHFVGMLAFRLPVPIRYDLPTWILSVTIAIVTSMLVLALVSRPSVRLRSLVAAAPAMGLAIVGMHYTGMAAMRIPAEIVYRPSLVALSGAIAITSSFVALWLAHHFSGAAGARGWLGKGVSAVVMGLAILGMHHTGMEAASFHPTHDAAAATGGLLIASRLLTVSVLVATFLVLGLALVAAGIDRRVRRAIVRGAELQEEALTRRSEARFRSLVQRSSDVIIILDARSVIQFASPAIDRVFGYGPEVVQGAPLVDFLHPDEASAAAVYFAQTRTSAGDVPPSVWRVRHQDGSWRHVECAAANLFDDPTVEGIVLNCRDITDRVNLEAQLTHQAFHDGLTGLANRALFRNRLEHALSGGGRRHTGVAVLFLDLDEFKVVNDTLGHAAGDALLRMVAARLQSSTRAGDTVARFGGDEFAVLVEDLPAHEEAIAVAERILAAFQAAFHLDGKPLRIGASIGIARAGDGEEPDDLLRNADLAMYQAKHAGRGSYAVFAPEMHSEVLDRLELQADLGRAVEGRGDGFGEFRLVYQPIVDLATERVCGVEALVRWDHPRRGALSPAAFIPLAEKTGLIVPLGRWILFEACREVGAWGGAPDADAPGPYVTVNLSGVQLQDPALPRDVAEALERSGLHPERLVLEITETAIVEDTQQVLATMLALKDLGVRLAIDDFGTGYSSLGYLQRFPVDILKIDKTFIDGVSTNGQAGALARTIIALGDMLSLRTVAEGVENVGQVLHLQALGCSFGQGYLFARPLSAEAASALVATGRLEPEPGTDAAPARKEDAVAV